jgi:hypothetical protein
MTNPPSPSQPDVRPDDYEQRFATAAAALAAAIRTEATDGGEIVSHLLATVAANLGGLYSITARRPGSWEADFVDRFLTSTVGCDGEYLLAYRTDPIEVVECVPATLDDLGIGQLYNDAYSRVTDAEEARLSTDPDEAALESSGEREEHAYRLIDQLRDADETAYRAAFEVEVQAAARQIVTDRHLPEAIPVTVRFVDWADSEQATEALQDWDTIEYQLWETAHDNTTPPGFDQPRGELRGDLADLLRQRDQLPLQRIPELAHYLHTAD